MKKSLKDTIVPDFSNFTLAKGKPIIRAWKKYKTPVPAIRALRPGNVIFMNYHATTVDTYDWNPVLIVVWSKQKYTLGLNVNWLDLKERKKLLRDIVKFKLTEKTQRQRMSVFRKIIRKKYPKSAWRLYFTDVIKKRKLYILDDHEFFDAITHKLIKKTKRKI